MEILKNNLYCRRILLNNHRERERGGKKQEKRELSDFCGVISRLYL